VAAAPFVRKLARDRGIDLEAVTGSGPHGRVRIADVEAHAVDDEPTSDIRPLRGLRKSIADHMVEAWRNAPQVTSMDLFDVTELVRARDLLLGTAQAEGARLTYLPFFIKAAIEALRAVPEANAAIGHDAIVLKRDFHIGIATAVPGGLVVPVVRHADRLNLLELSAEVDRLVRAARERRATPAELSGGTFTITSFGGLPGSPLFATPIVNYPEVAILGLGRIDLQPRVVDGQVVARQCIGVSFTFDHRVLDGEHAGRFMSALKRCIEQPLELLLRLR
jgi:pyruvate dehydrogenase E2 component (dihydrolipoamide acetyltransferase)